MLHTLHWSDEVRDLHETLDKLPSGSTPAPAGVSRLGQGSCRDLVLGAAFEYDTELGLGLWLSGRNGSYGPSPRAVGHDGFGGSFGLADPEAGISIGYVMNHMGTHIVDDPRKMALIDAVYKTGVA